jgi:putative acetyltransferase
MLFIRPTISSDVPGILKLIAEIYAEYGCVLDAEKEDTHLLNPGDYFRANGGEFWVIEEKGNILATGAVLLHPDHAELKSLYVHPSLRRQGWGRRLVEIAIAHARGAEKLRLILWSDTRFTAAHQLYKHLGFQRIGMRELHDSNRSVEFGFEILLL